MILLPHAKRIAHDSGRGMALPGLYSGRFLFGAVRHDPPKKRKPAVRAAGLLTDAIERE